MPENAARGRNKQQSGEETTNGTRTLQRRVDGAMGGENRPGADVAPAKSWWVNAATTVNGRPTEGIDDPTTDDDAGRVRP